MFRQIPGFTLYEMDENKTIRHIKTKNVKSPHRGGTNVRLYTEDGKELSRKIDKLFDLTFPEHVEGVLLEPYTQYRILKDGNIYSIYEAKMLVPGTTKDGYKQVSLKVADTAEHKSELVHRLVTEAYLPHQEGRYEVNHKDGDKSNNAVENLEWCNKNENIQHAYDTSLKKPIYRKCKVWNADSSLEFESLKDAADYLQVSTGAVNSTVLHNASGKCPTKGYAKIIGKYMCNGYVVEYAD